MYVCDVFASLLFGSNFTFKCFNTDSFTADIMFHQ